MIWSPTRHAGPRERPEVTPCCTCSRVISLAMLAVWLARLVHRVRSGPRALSTALSVDGMCRSPRRFDQAGSLCRGLSSHAWLCGGLTSGHWIRQMDTTTNARMPTMSGPVIKGTPLTQSHLGSPPWPPWSRPSTARRQKRPKYLKAKHHFFSRQLIAPTCRHVWQSCASLGPAGGHRCRSSLSLSLSLSYSLFLYISVGVCGYASVIACLHIPLKLNCCQAFRISPRLVRKVSLAPCFFSQFYAYHAGVG